MPSSAQEILGSAYASIRSEETNKAIAALTLDHLLQARIDDIEGGDNRTTFDAAGEKTGARVPKLAQLDELASGISKIISAVKTAGSNEGKLQELGLTSEST